LNRSNPRFSVPLRSPTRNGSPPRIGDLGRARLWRQMENDAKVLSVITLFFGIFWRLSTTKIISLGLHSRQNSEKFHNVLHFVGFRYELWLEDSEINFIRGYVIAAERDVLCECPQSSSLTSSDDEAAAYADDPLADKEWTSNYQKHVDVDKKLDSMKT